MGDLGIIKELTVDLSGVASCPVALLYRCRLAKLVKPVMPAMTMNFSAVVASADPDQGCCRGRLDRLCMG